MAKKKAEETPPSSPKEPGWFLGSVTFKQDYRCFKKDDMIAFKPGVTLLVGDQGSGKSTIFQLIREHQRHKDIVDLLALGQAPMKSFDLEMDLPRGKGYFMEKMPMEAQLAMMWASHGQSVKAVLNGIDDPKNSDTFFLFDEPDIGLSPRSCYQLAARIKGAVANGCQVVVSVHSPIVMQEIGEVFSVEHRKFMTAAEFLETQKQPAPTPPGKAKKDTKVGRSKKE